MSEARAPQVFGDRVAAVNAATERALYKARQPIYPKAVHGAFRALKWRFMIVLLGLYYLAPWLRYERGPGIPDQAILLDMTNSRFYFFFIEIWPEEIYFITGILILAAVGLFFVTALAGRLWCGYGCPQTVWTDLFIKVEEWVEGDRAARIRLDKAPWSASKVAKRVTKHALWLLIGMATGGAWIFYFADAPTLARQFVTFDAPLVAYTTVAFFTAATYVMAGFMREQVCTYMCPYSRFQGAMMDADTYTVTYKVDRGEPRGPLRKVEAPGATRTRGDCIDCTQCVAACPTGIDIRDGSQLECIACGLCIDACDDIMTRIGRPTGLIGYDTLANLGRRQAGKPESHDPIRPRTVLYFTLMMLVAGIMVITLEARSPLKLAVLHDRDPLYVVQSDGSIRNGFTVKVINRAYHEARFRISVDGIEGADLKIVGETTRDEDGLDVVVPADQLRSYRVHVRVPKGGAKRESLPLTFIAEDTEAGTTTRATTVFRSPQ